MAMRQTRNTGSRGVQGTWLQPFFGDNSAFSQNYFVCELGCSVSTVQRIINGEKQLSPDEEMVRKLTEAIQKDGLDSLKKLSPAELIEALCEAQSNAIRERDYEKAKRQSVDADQIKAALQRCDHAGMGTLVNYWCKTVDGDIDELALCLADHIQSGSVTKIRRIIDDPLESWIDSAQTSAESNINLQQIKRLEELIGTIAVSCAVPCKVEHLQPGEGIKVCGVDRDWSIRLVIDSALGYPLTHVHPTNHRPKVLERFAAELEGAESPCAEAQARQVLEQAEFEPFTRQFLTQLDNPSASSQDSKMPEPDTVGYENKMRSYCKDYNDAIFDANNESRDHRFLFTTGEFPRAVRERLNTLGITDLRIVESLQRHDLPPSLRIDHGKLSGWLTKCLTKIKNTAEKLVGEEHDLTTGNSIIIYASEVSSVGNDNIVLKGRT